MDHETPMSSQELAEELLDVSQEEADVTLCSDSGASRPESPWPLEPLI